MASSSSNPSASSSSSATSTPSAAPAASAALGVAPGASASATAPGVAPSAIAPASASATAVNVAPVATVRGVSRSIPPPPPPPPTTWGGSKRVPPPTSFSPALCRRGVGRGGRAPNSTGVYRTNNSATASQNVSRIPSTEEWAWATAPDPTSTFAKVMRSTDEGSSASSSSASPWSAPFTASSTVASTATETRPASIASSSTDASGSALAVETSAHNALGMDASKICHLAPGPRAEPSASASIIASATQSRDALGAIAPPNRLVLNENEWPRLGTKPAAVKKKGGSSQNTADALGATTSTPAPGAGPGHLFGSYPDPFSAWREEVQHVTPSLDSAWKAAPDPRSKFAPVMRSTEEGSSSSASAWPASSSTTPSRDSTLLPNASGSPPAVETSAHTAPGPGASTSAAEAQDRGTPTRSVEEAFGGIVPYPNMWTYRPEGPPPFFPRMCCQCHHELAAIFARPCGHLILCVRCYDSWFRLFCPGCGVTCATVYWRQELPRVWCWKCGLRPAEFRVTPCGHLAICDVCYDRRFFFSYCGERVTSWHCIYS